MTQKFADLIARDAISRMIVKFLFRSLFDKLSIHLLPRHTPSLTSCNFSDRALLEYSQISTMPPPTRDRLSTLQDWLERPAYGNAFLRGVEARAWDRDTPIQDFISLSTTSKDQDPMTRWLRKFLPGTYHRIIGHKLKTEDPDNATFDYKDDTVLVAIQVLSTILSSLAPTVSIFVLYFIKSTLVRLGLVLVFTSLFAVILSIFTNAKRVEIFAATTA